MESFLSAFAMSTRIYEKWLETNKDTGRSSGSRPIDVHTAIIEHFRDHVSIMIATEAAADLHFFPGPGHFHILDCEGCDFR